MNSLTTALENTIEHAVITFFDKLSFVLSNDFESTSQSSIYVAEKKDLLPKDIPNDVNLDTYADDQYIAIIYGPLWMTGPTIGKAYGLVKQILICLLGIRQEINRERYDLALREECVMIDDNTPVHKFLIANLVKIFGKQQAILAINQMYTWMETDNAIHEKFNQVFPEGWQEGFIAEARKVREISIKEIEATTSENPDVVSFVAMVSCLMEQKCPWKNGPVHVEQVFSIC